MTSGDIFAELELHPAFRALGADNLGEVASIAAEETVSRGEMIVVEGEDNADLFLLVSGSAAAVRQTGAGESVTLNAIRPGDCIGELSFLDGGRRAASVRAEEECRVIRIPAERLREFPNASALTGDLKGALAGVAVRRARAMSDDMLASLRHQLEITSIQNQFGHFLIFTMAIFLISTALFYLVAENYVDDVYDPGFSWQAVLFLAVPSLLIIRFLKIPLAELGIRKQGFLRSFGEAIALCSVISVPASIYLFGFKPEAEESQPGVTVNLIFLIQYFFHTLFQELGARGLLQGLFQKFLNDQAGHRAILLTSTTFASLHLAFGVDAVVVTFFASILLGYFYRRHKNLIGVTVLHYWLGVLAAIMVAF